jgi:hypothetical protein
MQAAVQKKLSPSRRWFRTARELCKLASSAQGACCIIWLLLHANACAFCE